CTGIAQPTAAVDGSGDAILAFDQSTPTFAAWWSARTPDGPWSVPARFTPDGEPGGSTPALAAGGDGPVTAIWSATVPLQTAPWNDARIEAARTTRTLAETAAAAPKGPAPPLPASCDAEFPPRPKPLP